MKHIIFTALIFMSVLSTLQAREVNLTYYEKIVDSNDQSITPEKLYELEDSVYNQPKPEDLYSLAKAFSTTSERVWAVVYGELYCNQTSNAETFLEISQLMGSMFEKSLTYEGKGKVSISFMAVAGVSQKSSKIPFEMSFEISTIHKFTDYEKFENLSLATIHQVRMNQVQAWEDKNLDEHGLINWHKKLSKSGLFEAYNYWLFQNFRPDEYSAWKSNNQAKLKKFLKWRKLNKINLSKDNWHRRH